MQYNKETKTLSISYEFNEELKDIPEDTQIIIFQNKHPNYSNFNQKVDNLPKYFLGFPQNLTHLTFGLNFNQKVDNLPQSLTHLTFGLKFNQKVDNLPQSLTHLTFGSKFNKKVVYLPKNLTHLNFEWYYYQKIDKLPKNLKKLKLGYFEQNKIIIPKNLNELGLQNNNNLINNLPNYIEKIHIFFDYDDLVIQKVENLPITIKEIIINDEKYKKYIKIPFGCILTIKN